MTRYRVRHHDWLKDETRLLLVKENGDSLQFTRMDRRATIVHANHRLFIESNATNKQETLPAAEAVGNSPAVVADAITEAPAAPTEEVSSGLGT